MSFSAVEQSEFLGQLTEYFRFLTGGTAYLYTGAGESLTLSTGTGDQNGDYAAIPVSLTNLEHTRSHGDFTVSISVPRDNEVAAFFRAYVPDDGVQVWVYRKHESDDEVTTWFAGEVISCEWKESEAVLICQPNAGKMGRLGLWMRWQPTCNLQVYSTRCGVDPADFSSDVTITAIDGLTVTVSGMPAVADGYYNGGYVTFDGMKRHVEMHVGNDLTLLLDLDSLAVSDTVSVTAGCDGQHTTCRAKFFPAGGSLVAGVGNIRNFLGFFTTPDRNIFKDGLGTGGQELPSSGSGGFSAGGS